MIKRYLATLAISATMLTDNSYAQQKDLYQFLEYPSLTTKVQCENEVKPGLCWAPCTNSLEAVAKNSSTNNLPKNEKNKNISIKEFFHCLVGGIGAGIGGLLGVYGVKKLLEK